MPRTTSDPRLIASAGNELVRRLSRLGRAREAPDVLLEGPRIVREAVACGVPIELLAVREGTRFDVPAERTVVLSERAFAAASQTVTPQGVLAIAHRDMAAMPEALAAARGAGWPLLVLDGLQDPGNVGTICRTAAAAGAPAVAVLEGGADPLGAKAVRASAGAVFRLTIARGSWAGLAGLDGLGAAATGGTPWHRASLTAAPLIAFGSEAHGLRRDDLQLVTIPMAPGVESLNVAAAAAVVLFEIRRRLETS